MSNCGDEMKKKENEVLRQSALFAKLSDEDYETVLRYIEQEPAVFATGSTVYSPSGYQRSLGIILKGTARVKRENGTLMSVLSAGDVFGIPVLFSSKPFPTDIEAKEECRVLFIPKDVFASLMRNVPSLAEIFCVILSDRIFFLNDRLESVSSACSDDKLYSYLLNCSDKTGSKTFSLPLSMSSLASVLSVGRTSLYRSFDDLTEKGLILKDGKKITIV